MTLREDLEHVNRKLNIVVKVIQWMLSLIFFWGSFFIILLMFPGRGWSIIKVLPFLLISYGLFHMIIGKLLKVFLVRLIVRYGDVMSRLGYNEGL